MKKLLVALLVVAPFTFSMEPQKQKRKESSLSNHLDYLNHSAIDPFYISAVDGQKVAGQIYFGACKKNPHHGHIDYVNVIDAYRGKGIGYELFQQAVLSLKNKGFRVITWDAIALEDVPTEQLEEIYLAYIHKLRATLEFDFIMEKRLGCLGTLVTPMKIILKESGGIYPEKL
jgi:ribosomal protein S18 acetylase RimI-like enzyme